VKSNCGSRKVYVCFQHKKEERPVRRRPLGACGSDWRCPCAGTSGTGQDDHEIHEDEQGIDCVAACDSCRAPRKSLPVPTTRSVCAAPPSASMAQSAQFDRYRCTGELLPAILASLAQRRYPHRALVLALNPTTGSRLRCGRFVPCLTLNGPESEASLKENPPVERYGRRPSALRSQWASFAPAS
jgi:hypothetical protein